MKPVLMGMLCLAGALSVAGAPGAGLAPLPDRGREVKSITVSFADLDLGSAQGAQTLYDRLRSAARRVCGKADLRDIAGAERVKRCRSEALDAAVVKIDHPRLTALHGKPDKARELVGYNLRPPAQY